MSLVVSALMAGLLMAAPAATLEDRSAQGIAFEVTRDEGAERCPDRASLAVRLAERLAEKHGTSRFPVAESPYQRVDIAIVRTEEGYVGTVAVLGVEGGTRRLVDAGEDCAGLSEALTLTLSMIADGQPMTTVKRPDAPTAARSARAWEIGGGAIVSANLLGAPMLGMALDAVFYPWPRLAIGMDALWMPSRAVDKAGSTSKVQVAAALAKVCLGALPFGGPVFPALCGNVGGGTLRGEGDSAVYADARTVWRPWFAAGPTFHVGIRLYQRLTLAAHAGYLFSLLREHFTSGGPDQNYQVYESGHPGWTGGAGLLVRIP